MAKALPAIAAVIGMVLIAGTSTTLALGLGCIGVAAYLVVNDIVERLDRIEVSVADRRHEADAKLLAESLAHSHPPAPPSDSQPSQADS